MAADDDAEALRDALWDALRAAGEAQLPKAVLLREVVGLCAAVVTSLDVAEGLVAGALVVEVRQARAKLAGEQASGAMPCWWLAVTDPQ